MTRIRRGGYIFVTWIGDHPPRHVHVFRDRELILKWNLELDEPLSGDAPQFVIDLIHALQLEGRI